MQMMRAHAVPRVEQMIDALAAQHPDRPALIYGERSWTYAQLRAEMYRRAAILVAAGLQPGEVVATTESVTDTLALSCLATLAANLTFFHLSSALATAERTPLLVRAGARVLLTADGAAHPAHPELPTLPVALPGIPPQGSGREVARRGAGSDAESVAVLGLTSGTTNALPKLVCVPHRTMTWRYGASSWWQQPGDIFYRVESRYFHVRSFLMILATGGTLVFSQTMDPQQMEAEIAGHRASVMQTNGPIIRLLTEQTRPSAPEVALRAFEFGGMALPDAILQAAAARYDARVFPMYASTEGGTLISAGEERNCPVGSIGKPYPGVRARTVDEAGVDVAPGAIGELIVQSPGMMRGYLDAPEETSHVLRDGWLWTGDFARQDAAGFFFLEGRRALRINVGGFKVAPEEVEAILLSHPAVRDAVVVGTADPERGEIVKAVIVLRGAPPSIAELRRYCRAHLAVHKVPRVWVFRDELPRSQYGKVQRHLL